jgi:hypothetical protein
MSSRHKLRLLRERGGLLPAQEKEQSEESEEEVEEDEPEEEEQSVDNENPAGFFAFLSEESEDESDEEEDDGVSPPTPTREDEERDASTSAVCVPLEAEDRDAEDHRLMDDIIAEMGTGSGNLESSETGSFYDMHKVLRCDPLHLNLERELRRHFGVSVASTAPGRQARTRGGLDKKQRKLSQVQLKKLVLGPPPEDWPSRPPSFVGGGIGMVRCDAPAGLSDWMRHAHGESAEWFEFKLSDAYVQLDKRYEMIQATHDLDLLAVFVSQTPYHVDALMQLAMVYAHQGQMDRASDMVRSTLFIFEMAYGAGFAPLSTQCRLDVATHSNAVYMGALFRHMQLCGMRGAFRTSMEVGRLLLSYDPLADPMGTLLYLDAFALRAGEPGFVIDLVRSHLPIGPRHLPAPPGQPNVTIEDMPGPLFSFALALLCLGERAEALDAMKFALLKFPLALEALLVKAGVDNPRQSTQPRNFSALLKHETFSKSAAESPLLRHLIAGYVSRAQYLWAGDPALDLLFDGAALAIHAQLDAAAERRLQEAYVSSSPLQKYLGIPMSDLEDSFPRLPVEGLLDPRQRLRFAGVRPDDIAALRLRAVEDRRQAVIEAQAWESPQGNLDLHLPLAELFWRSALPWNRI